MPNVLIIVWAVLLAAFVIIEAATAQLVTIWFAAGSLMSLIAAVLHAPFRLQIIIFVLVSLITLVLTRPIVKKITQNNKQSLNADRCIGETAIVTEAINNINASGAVKVNGIIWTARSENGENIPEGTLVKINKIEGVKLIVLQEDK